jgi:hypothetical protein
MKPKLRHEIATDIHDGAELVNIVDCRTGSLEPEYCAGLYSVYSTGIPRMRGDEPYEVQELPALAHDVGALIEKLSK